MKRLLCILLLAIVAGLSAYFICYRTMIRPARELSQSSQPTLAWLTSEFHLNDNQAQRIGQLEAAYAPVCAIHCQQISENQSQISRQIAAQREVTPELASLLQTSAALQTTCHQEMLAHIYAVAAVMPPGEADRYIGLMKRQILEPGMPHRWTSSRHE
ncbi:MAG: hypothetical protein ABIT76_14785 [Chthoniobacterales bacterium]